MKTTLLLICSLLCLLYFATQIIASGIPTVYPDEAANQVTDPVTAEAFVRSQESFNLVTGIWLSGVTSIALLASVISLVFLKKQRILRWFRAGLLLSNIVILITCSVLFFITLVESQQPEPACLKLVWPWLDSYFAKDLRQTQQLAMFLSLCCGMLSGVNCMSFYLFYRRRKYYNDY